MGMETRHASYDTPSVAIVTVGGGDPFGGRLVTPYAAYLITIIAEAFRNEPERFGECQTFQELHDVCDANEFIIDADNRFGIDMAFDDEGEGEYFARANAACDEVDAWLSARVAA